MYTLKPKHIFSMRQRRFPRGEKIAAANRPFYELRNQLRFGNLRINTKFALYKTKILPVALYGHKAWTLKRQGKAPVFLDVADA